jgi:tRNA threonylcarbamoyladenosine biosynthesis protein TsaB
MIILTIRTDKPEAEIGLYNNESQLAYKTWEAHRELSVTIHNKIEELLKSQKKTWQDLDGIVCYKGPGSFTGLRIGLTLANTLADALHIPITGTTGKDWAIEGIKNLPKSQNNRLIVPEYGQDPHITVQKK